MNSNINMERPKRVISKPTRYQTTSSDEEPRKRLKVSQGSFAEDVVELRGTLEDVVTETTYTPERQTYTPERQTYTPHRQTYTPHSYMFTPHTNTHIPDTSIYPPHTNTYTPDTNIYPSHTSTHNPDADMYGPITYTNSGIGTTTLEPANPQIKDLYQKMNNLESMMTKTHGLLEKVLKQQQLLLQNHRTPSKPAFLPISSVAEMTEFNKINDDGYREAVNYLEYLGGFNLKEAVTLCFKEIFSDCLVKSYSWLGREDDNDPLCETRAVRAIHDAVLHNRHFPRPSRKEVADNIKVALRTAKERVRSKGRGPRKAQNPRPDDFWRNEGETN